MIGIITTTTGEITDSGVEPPESVATEQAPAEGQSTITAAGSSVATLMPEGPSDRAHSEATGTILSDPDVSAMLEAGARWNDALRRART